MLTNDIDSLHEAKSAAPYVPGENPERAQSNTLLDCSTELLKDTVHSAIVDPLSSLLQLCGQSKLELLMPDEKATGAKAVARQMGEMAGNIFDFMVLRKAAKSLPEQTTSIAGKDIDEMVRRNVRLSVTTGLVQGYVFTPVEHGNGKFFSADRLEQGTIGASSMMAMDASIGLTQLMPAMKSIPENYLGRLGRSAIAGAVGGAGQSELTDRIKQGHWASAGELRSAAIGGAFGGAAFHTVADASMRTGAYFTDGVTVKPQAVGLHTNQETEPNKGPDAFRTQTEPNVEVARFDDSPDKAKATSEERAILVEPEKPRCP